MAMCKLIGNPCATYGPYTFYKAFKYTKNGKVNILALGEFFFVKLWSDSDLVSIGELTLLWEDRNSEQTLAALRLYILPENTPDGRNDIHGEDEVLSITEKVVLRLEDLLTWLTEDADWNWGLGALWQGGGEVKKTATPTSLNSLNASSNIDFFDVEKEKEALGDEHWESNRGVIVLSFTRYCRYRGLLSRYAGVDSKFIKSDDVIALGGFYVPYKNTKVLFCKDTFDYPDLEGHELLCNHLAPKYKGRTKKRKKLLLTHHPDTDSGSESSSTVSSSNKSPHKCGLRVRLKPSRKSPRTNESAHERDFLNKLYQYMKTRKTPIGKVPTIGFKELDLYKLFHKVKHLGGYEEVTVGRLWKYVFAEVGGEQGTTSSGTLSRKHYERLLLPYEKYLNGEVDKSSPSGGGTKQSNNFKDKPLGKNNNSTGKVNGYASIGGNGNKNKDLPRSPKESPVITLEESSNSSSNSNSNSNLTTCGNGTDKDKPSNFSMVKRKIVMEGNSSSLRNARLKLEKPQNGNNGNGVVDRDVIEIKPNISEPIDVKPDVKTNGQASPAQELNIIEPGQTSPPRDKVQTSPCREKAQMSPPRDKENIPLGNKPGDKRQAPPEVIDITDDAGPQSINAFKKQKLDILKYQGLEVTPVSSEDVKPPIAHPPPTLPPTPIVTPHVDFHQRERNKISITVTPDVSLLIKPQHSPTPPTTTPSTPKLFCNPPLSSNLFSPYQHGTKTVYGNPKEVLSNPKEVPTFPSPKEQVYNNPKDVFNTPKDIFNSSKETFNSSPKDVFNNPKDLYNNAKDLYSHPKDIFNRPKELYNNPKDLFNDPKNVFNDPKNLFNNSKDLYKTPKDIFNSQKDSLYNNPPKELLYGHPKKDLFSPKDKFSKSKDTFSPASTKDSFNNVNSLKDMFSPNNFKDLLNNPGFRDMLGNPAFKDFFSNPTLKDMLNAPSSSPTPPTKTNNYLSSPSKDNTSHYTPHHNRYNNSSLLHKPSPACDDVLDLKVKPHPSLPATLSTTGQSLKRSTTQDEVLDLTVKNNPGKSNLEITLLPSTPSHRPYEMKRPLPVPLSRPSVSPVSNHSITKHTASSTSTSPSHHNKSNHSLNQHQHQHQQHQNQQQHQQQHHQNQQQHQQNQHHHQNQQQHQHHQNQQQQQQHHQHNMKKTHSLPILPPSPSPSSHNTNRSKRKPSSSSSSSSSSLPLLPTSRAPSHLTFPSHTKTSTPTSTSPFNNHLAAAAAAQNAAAASKNPYMPMLDPMYFAALYSGLFPPSNFMNPSTAALFSPPVTGGASSAGAGNSTAQDAALNIYKELLKAQNSSLFPNLFNDGSTSISLVGNNSKPSPK